MSDWGGMVPTGRRIAGPSADLVELDDGRDGAKHTGIAFHESYRDKPQLLTAIDLAKSFMEFPMVTGLVECSNWLPEQGVAIYPTGTSWTAAEVVRFHRDNSATVGTRSSLETLYLAGLILAEAAQTGPIQGVFSHGSLSPLRLLFKADGQLQIIGYGIPQVELMVWRDDESLIPHEDAFRYAPPERISGAAENGDADLFGLALIAYEFLTGEPVYDGSVEEIQQQATRGEAAARIDKAAKARKLAGPIRDILYKACQPEPSRRYEAPAAFVADVEALLTGLQSESLPLGQVMDKVQRESRHGRALAGGPPAGRREGRGRGVPVAGMDPGLKKVAPGTGIPIHSFAPTAGGKAAAPPGGEAAGTPSRWGKSGSRDKAPAAVERPALEDRKAAAPAAEKADPRAALRERLKKREEGGAEAAPAAEKAEAKADPRDALRDRLRARAGGGEAAPAEAAQADNKPAESKAAESKPAAAAEKPVEAADARAALREKLRQRTAGAEPAKEAAKPEAPAKAAEPPKTEPARPAEAAPAAVSSDAGAAADPREALRKKLRERQEKGG